MNKLVGIIIAIGLAYYIIGIAVVMIKVHSVRIRSGKRKAVDESRLPPVSILKPVNGIDGNLYENLLSFINQDYPQFEIVVGFQSADDPAVELVDRLRHEFPDRKIQLAISDRKLGYNPKVNNIHGMMPLASYDFMVISDSNVIVDKDYLRSNISYFEDGDVGLVSNLIKGVGGKTLGALFENLHLNSYIIENVSMASMVGQEIPIGKSMFFKKSQLDSLGGIYEFRNYLAEDYLIGRAYENHGYRVIVSPYLISSTNHSWTLKKFMNRHVRWAQLRWNLNKPAYFGELFENFPFWSIVYAAVTAFSYESLFVVLLCWAAKITGDSLMNAVLDSGIGLKECLWAPVKDLFIAVTWPVPVFHSKTKWRGNLVKITKDTLLLPAEK